MRPHFGEDTAVSTKIFTDQCLSSVDHSTIGHKGLQTKGCEKSRKTTKAPEKELDLPSGFSQKRRED